MWKMLKKAWRRFLSGRQKIQVTEKEKTVLLQNYRISLSTFSLLEELQDFYKSLDKLKKTLKGKYGGNALYILTGESSQLRGIQIESLKRTLIIEIGKFFDAGNEKTTICVRNLDAKITTSASLSKLVQKIQKARNNIVAHNGSSSKKQSFSFKEFDSILKEMKTILEQIDVKIIDRDIKKDFREDLAYLVEIIELGEKERLSRIK